MGLSEESVTILKYCLKGDYMFKVMDKFDEPDEVARLDKMIAWSHDMQDTYFGAYQQIWAKTCPIFPTS